MASTSAEPAPGRPASPVLGRTALRVLGALSLCHLLNDLMQSLLPAIYPMLKTALRARLRADRPDHASPTRLTASLLQPVVGFYTDRAAEPYSLAIGMGFTLARPAAARRRADLSAACCSRPPLVGVGSSVFHPESSRVARLASGGRHGFAQSLFQVGGNAGSALGPLLAAFVVLPRGQRSIAWFAVAALVAMALLTRVGRWYRRARSCRRPPRAATRAVARLPPRRVPGVARDPAARWSSRSTSTSRA